MSMRLSVCLSVSGCVSVQPISKKDWVNQIEHIVVYGYISDMFDIGYCPIKVKVRVTLNFFLRLLQHKLLSSIW